jgi:hypothetical protein
MTRLDNPVMESPYKPMTRLNNAHTDRPYEKAGLGQKSKNHCIFGFWWIWGHRCGRIATIAKT